MGEQPKRAPGQLRHQNRYRCQIVPIDERSVDLVIRQTAVKAGKGCHFDSVDNVEQDVNDGGDVKAALP